MRRTLLLLSACIFLLTGCEKAPAEGSTVFEWELSPAGTEHKEELLQSSLSTIESRINALALEPLENVSVTHDSGRIVITGLPEEIASELDQKLQQRFALNIMKQVPLEEARLVLAETDGYADTAFTEQHVKYLTIIPSNVPGSAVIEVELTTEGSAVLRQVYQEHLGEHLSIFVRDRPIYQFLVEEDDLQKTKIYMTIPAPELGKIFVDDVNTSLYVSFRRIQ